MRGTPDFHAVEVRISVVDTAQLEKRLKRNRLVKLDPYQITGTPYRAKECEEVFTLELAFLASMGRAIDNQLYPGLGDVLDQTRASSSDECQVRWQMEP